MRELVEHRFSDVPEAHTFGNDEVDALARAADALATVIGAYRKDGDIPAPSTMPSIYRVSSGA